MVYTLKVSDIRRVFVGAKVLACGGGGESEWAEPLLQAIEERGLEVRVASSEDLRDGDWVCVPGGLGAGTTPEIRERLQGVAQIAPPERILPEMGERALAAFERCTELEFDKFLPVNTGPLHWGQSMYLAALRGKPCLDGDCAGRAIPQWTLTTLNVKGLPLTPAVFVSSYGDRVTFDATATNERLEEIGRPVAVASGGWGVFIACAARGSEMRDAYVPAVIEKAQAVGAAIEMARERGEDPVDPCLEAAEGLKLFEGRVISYDRREESGFRLGDISVEGIGPFEGSRCDVHQMSEYAVAWVDGNVVATCPDSICIVDRHTAEGLTAFADAAIGPFPSVRQADFQPGREIVIFAIPAHAMWRGPRGVELFGPRSFGFDIDYIPVERRLGLS